jgi:oligopeptide/dipeptide ABC transporter ATP-binding protein
MTEDIICVKSLKKEFTRKGQFWGRKKSVLKAVDGLDFSIKKGETFGLVGESGCGKTTTGRMIVRLLEPTSGKIYFHNNDLTAKNDKQMLPLRRNLQMIFQNPYGSLNPKMSLQQILEEPLKIHKLYCDNRQKRIDDLLDCVGVSKVLKDRYPEELSGGQRQRVAIARALALNPEFIVADEPVSALDVSIQAQILNLLLDLQKELKLTCLFISHDLSVVQYISNRAAVMYLGKIVELADCQSLYEQPLHPYTKMLLECVPIADPRRKFKIMDAHTCSSQVTRTVRGCSFYPRCCKRLAICALEEPQLKEIAPGRRVACHIHA